METHCEAEKCNIKKTLKPGIIPEICQDCHFNKNRGRVALGKSIQDIFDPKSIRKSAEKDCKILKK